MNMNWKRITGSVIALAGLGLVIWNAYTYLDGRKTDSALTASGLILCLIGAFLIKKGRMEK